MEAEDEEEDEKTPEEFLLGKRAGDIKVLGAMLHSRIQSGEEVSLLGQKVETAEDLADIAQVYRDPRYETFRAVYTKDGVVVGQNAYSSRLPSVVALSKKIMQNIIRDARLLKSDGVYFLHNHPSGDPTPSDHDIALTKAWSKEFDGKFNGHVIINHTQGTVIEANGSTRRYNVDNESLWDLGKAEVPHELLGAKISDSAQLGAVAMKLNASPSRGVVLFTDVKSKVVALVDASQESFKDANKAYQVFAAYRRVTRKLGAGGFKFLVVDEFNSDEQVPMLQRGLFTDIVNTKGESLREQSRLRFFDEDRSTMDDGKLVFRESVNETKKSYGGGAMDKKSFAEMLKSFASEIRKEFREEDHPRADDGRFIEKADIEKGAKDAAHAASIMQRVTDLDQFKALVGAFKKAGMDEATFEKAMQLAGSMGENSDENARPNSQQSVPTELSGLMKAFAQGGFSWSPAGRNAPTTAIWYRSIRRTGLSTMTSRRSGRRICLTTFSVNTRR